MESKNLCTTKMQNKNRKGRKAKQLGRFKDIKISEEGKNNNFYNSVINYVL